MQQCCKCLMDQTDPDIVFDVIGICNHCRTYNKKVKEQVIDGDAGLDKAYELVNIIKNNRYGKKYDCVIGVSGGVDSSYLAYMVKELGLNPLAVHFDNGWNTEESTKNVKLVLDDLGIDLYTYVIDWEEFRDLQLSFLMSSTPDSEIPTDHAIVAILNQVALQYKIPYIISGANVRTESHIPAAWSQGHWDWRYIQEVQRQFGHVRLKTYPHINLFNMLRVKWIRLLNYLEYDKEEAKQFLISQGWVDYGWKHTESIYTRFYQGYILPVKFGYDKRKSHLSSLICSGIITKEEALEELNKETYSDEQLKADYDYVIKKLGITEDMFIAIMHLPKRNYHEFRNNSKLIGSDWYQTIYKFMTKV